MVWLQKVSRKPRAPMDGKQREAKGGAVPTDLVLIGGVLVVVAGVLIFFLIRRQNPPEPPHLG